MFATIIAALIGGHAIAPEITQDIADTRAIASAGDGVWPGFSTAPFSMLLITEDGEYLLCDDRTPSGFSSIEADIATGCSVKRGPRSWRSPGLLAAMPLFGPGEVIAMGSPEATGISRAAWRRTILHEHFHQWQGQLPHYYARTLALDLADGDESGMWMIQYPFPYGDAAVGDAYRAAADALLVAIAASDAYLPQAVEDYLEKRRAFARAAGERNWRYYEFQLWKEGVARWTEVEIARRAGGEWAADAATYWEQQLSSLRSDRLDELGRTSVYAFGAAEAAVLDRASSNWRVCYPTTLQLGDCWKPIALAQGKDD